MTIQYPMTVVLPNKTYNTNLHHFELTNNELFLAFQIENVWFETDGFDERPYIVYNQELVGKENLFQLQCTFPYQDKSIPLYLLECFHLTVSVPVIVYDLKQKKNSNETLLIALWTDESNMLHHKYSLLGEESFYMDSDDALHELGKKLSKKAIIKVCGCCKYGTCNPYGDIPFYNHLCFQQEGNFAFDHDNFNKQLLMQLMENERYQRHLIIDVCPHFQSRYIVKKVTP